LLPNPPLFSTTTSKLHFKLCFVFSVVLGLQAGCGANSKQMAFSTFP
jgi:hypothetical protein